ncbi:MAG: WYL domain-containing protein [Bacteroidetes bacterium]|nr:WYL domain-containing protein [Bacteroidota bacterium]
MREKGTSHRVVEPISIIQKNGKKHLVGWCRLRNDYRTFIVDRMTTVKVKNENFEKRADFDESVFLNELYQSALESSPEV